MTTIIHNGMEDHHSVKQVVKKVVAVAILLCVGGKVDVDKVEPSA